MLNMRLSQFSHSELVGNNALFMIHVAGICSKIEKKVVLYYANNIRKDIWIMKQGVLCKLNRNLVQKLLYTTLWKIVFLDK